MKEVWLGSNGITFAFHCFSEDFEYRYRYSDWVDNEELLAQGRYAENAKNRREFNRLPKFNNRFEALQAFESGLKTHIILKGMKEFCEIDDE